MRRGAPGRWRRERSRCRRQALASGPGPARRRRGTGSSSARRGRCIPIPKYPRARHARGRSRFDGAPPPCRIRRGACQSRRASRASASGIQTSSRSRRAAWAHRPQSSADAPTRTSDPGRVGGGQRARNCRGGPPTPAGRSSRRRCDARWRCIRWRTAVATDRRENESRCRQGTVRRPQVGRVPHAARWRDTRRLRATHGAAAASVSRPGHRVNGSCRWPVPPPRRAAAPFP